MMNLQVLLAALPLLASLCNGQSPTATEQYNQLCPSKDGQEVETQPGLFVTYNCDKATVTSIRAVANSAANANDCVLACEQSTGCSGSMWSARPGSACYLVQSTSQPDLRTKTQLVYMSYRRVVEEPVDQFPDDDEPVDQFPDDDASEANCAAQNAACERNSNVLETSLNECQAREEEWGKKQHALNQCPTNDNKRVTHGNLSYTVYCNKRNIGMTQLRLTTDGFDECLAACSADSKCKAVHYVVNWPKPCKMLATFNRNVKPILSETVQIAAVPVVPR